MKPEDLDLVYTELCNTMTEAGKERAELFLARLALLFIINTTDLEQVRKLIAEAAAIEPI